MENLINDDIEIIYNFEIVNEDSIKQAYKELEYNDFKLLYNNFFTLEDNFINNIKYCSINSIDKYLDEYKNYRKLKEVFNILKNQKELLNISLNIVDYKDIEELIKIVKRIKKILEFNFLTDEEKEKIQNLYNNIISQLHNIGSKLLNIN